MKNLIIIIVITFLFASCEKDLETKTFTQLSTDSFFKNQYDAISAVTAMYCGLMGGFTTWQGGWGAAQASWRVQDSQTTDELVCNWDDGGSWVRLNKLNFNPDFWSITQHYNTLMPYISNITVNISKIQEIQMDIELRSRLIGELKALRAYYSQILYNYYGPVPIRVDAETAADPGAKPIPRPSIDEMVAQIENDYKEAAEALPVIFTGENYGRFSKAACLTGLMKLYMHEKKWQDAVNTGEQIKTMGFSLAANYADNFSYLNKGGNSELILAVPCSPTAWPSTNMWLAHVLPTDYRDPSGIPLTEWGGYRMPWKTYFKFDTIDKRLAVLLKDYPTDNGIVDSYARGDKGAVPMKFGPDPTRANSQNSGVDFPIFRYADIVLLLAEALNELNNGPTTEAYDLLNDIRNRAGVPVYNYGTLSQNQFRNKLQDERLFELWCEGTRREDLIRWGLYIQRAIEDGSEYAIPSRVLYPLPRTAITQSNGVVVQNPEYN